MSERAKVAVFCDSPGENWRAMDLAGEMLTHEWSTRFSDAVVPTSFTIDLPRIARRFAGGARSAFNVDRAAGRFLVYPAYAAQQRRAFDFFHVVDHSYAHLVHVLPAARTGVFCHDVDAFRSLFKGGVARARWFRGMQRWTLAGMRRASVVFYSTEVVRREIEREGLVPHAHLVRAPFGISPEFDAVDRDDPSVRELLAPLEGRPYLLHVGSAVPRKRLDVLFETFARVRAKHPALRLVQNGASLSSQQRAHVERLGIGDALIQPAAGKIDRAALAQLYRRAKGVLVTSDSEGFGLPVIEALACGAVVFASDIPVLREVAGDAAVLCPCGEPDAWAARVTAYLDGELDPPRRDARIVHAAQFTWSRHAATILDAYRSLESG